MQKWARKMVYKKSFITILFSSLNGKRISCCQKPINLLLTLYCHKSWICVPNTRDVFVWYMFLKVSIYTSLRVPGAFGLQKISIHKILVRRIPGVCLIRL